MFIRINTILYFVPLQVHRQGPDGLCDSAVSDEVHGKVVYYRQYHLLHYVP